MSKKMKVFVLLSVLLNLLLVGVIIGHASHRWGKSHWRQEQVAATLEHLPQGKQALVKETMAKAFREGRGLHKEIRKERKETVGIILAEPFDETAYDTHVAAIHRLRGEQMHLFSEAVKQLAKELTPEERKALAGILRQPPWRKGHCPHPPGPTGTAIAK